MPRRERCASRVAKPSASTRCSASSAARSTRARRASSSCSRRPGRLLPRALSLCLAPPGELAFLLDPVGPGTEALCALEPGDAHPRLRPARERLPARRRAAAPRRRRRRHRAAARISPEMLGSPPAVLGFRTAAHAEAAALLPGAEVVVDPILVTDCNLEGYDVLACGPEPMLHAVAARCPGAQLAWEAPMACGYGGVLRLRRRDRRRAETTLCGRTGPRAAA